MGSEEARELVNKHFEDHFSAEKEWAASIGAEVEPLEAAKATATGTITWGGLVKGVFKIELTFDETGVKRTFNGKLYWNVAGVTEGVGSYRGAVPKVGAKWNFTASARDVGAGYVAIAFNPFLGPRGHFVAASAGGGFAGFPNYGVGIWTEG